MPRRSRDAGEHRRSRTGRARRYGGGTVIAGSAAGALWALAMNSATAPQANADVGDLIFQPIVDAISQAVSAVEPGLQSALDSSVDLSGLFSSLDSTLDLSSLSTHALADVGSAAATAPLQSALDSSVDLSGLFNSLDPTLDLSSLSTHALTDVGSAAATAPLPVLGNTEPILDISVNGGAETPVLVDTGSDGLVVPIQDIGWQTLSFPTGLGFGSYSGGLDYFYLTFDMPVDINGVTADGPVDVALFEFPTNFESFLGGTGDGILGIGPDSAGPGPGIITNDFPLATGDSGGIYIDEPAHQIIFDSSNPGTPFAELSGAPISEAYVSINGGAPIEVETDFDSGGVYGAIPQSVLPASLAGDSTLPPGTEITVYAPDHTELYSYVTTATNTPTVVSSGDFDTGYEPFAQGPIYIETAGQGATIFDYSAK